MIGLILKEAIFNIRRKIMFYLSFLAFMIIVLGTVIGLLSFGFNLSNQLGPILRGIDPNISFTFDTKGLDIKDDAKKEIGDALSKAGYNGNTNFFKSIEKKHLNNKPNQINEYQRLLNNGGWISNLSKDLVMENFADELKTQIEYYSSNIFYWYFFNENHNYSELIDSSQFEYNVNFRRTMQGNTGRTSENRNIVTIGIYNDANFALKKNKQNFSVIKGKSYSEDGIYLSPKFLDKLNLKIGDKYNLYLEDIRTTITETIVGTAVDKKTFSEENDIVYLTKNTISHLNKAWLDNETETYYYGLKTITAETEIKDNLQNKAIILSDQYFVNGNIINSSPVYDAISTKINEESSIDIGAIVSKLIPLLLIIIALAVALILVTVNLLVTKQSAKLNLSNIKTLKDEGSSNWTLSLLNSFEVLPFLLISLVAGFFIALWLQNYVAAIVMKNFNFQWTFFHITPITISSALVFFIVVIITFFVVNIFSIRKILNAAQYVAPSKNAVIFSKMLKNSNSHMRINLNLAFTNIGKNISLLFLTSLSMGSFIFSMNFIYSLRQKSNEIVRLIKPYDSISYMNTDYQWENDDASPRNVVLPKIDFKDENTLKSSDYNVDDNVFTIMDKVADQFRTYYNVAKSEPPGYIEKEYIAMLLNQHEEVIKNAINDDEAFAKLATNKNENGEYEGFNLFFGKFFSEPANNNQFTLQRIIYDIKENMNTPMQTFSHNQPISNMFLPRQVDFNINDSKPIIDVSVSARLFYDRKMELNKVYDFDDKFFNKISSSSESDIVHFKVTKVVNDNMLNRIIYADQYYIDRIREKFVENHKGQFSPNDYKYDADWWSKSRNYSYSENEDYFFTKNIVINTRTEYNNFVGKSNIEIFKILLDRIKESIESTSAIPVSLLADEVYNSSIIIRQLLIAITIIIALVDILTVVLFSTMVVYQNTKILAVMKTMGYKRFQLTRIIGSGYMISVFAGTFLAGIFAQIVFNIMSSKLASAFGKLTFYYTEVYWGIIAGLLLIYLVSIYGVIYEYIKTINCRSSME